MYTFDQLALVSSVAIVKSSIESAHQENHRGRLLPREIQGLPFPQLPDEGCLLKAPELESRCGYVTTDHQFREFSFSHSYGSLTEILPL